jgi:hypothetical protein
MKGIALAAVLVFSIAVYGQQSIPVGTVLPVLLTSSITKKSQPGQPIKAIIAQDVLLANGAKIPRGAHVLGNIVAAAPARTDSPEKVSFQFDRLVVPHESTPMAIKTDLRALASPIEIEDAQLPETNDRGTPSTAYTTVQVGNDEVVYRGGGHVMNASEVVGEPVYGGVLGQARANSTRGCRGEVGGNDETQSLWVFATDACGVYGYHDVSIANAGRSGPAGEIVLTSKHDIDIRGGSGMLLRVISNP